MVFLNMRSVLKYILLIIAFTATSCATRKSATAKTYKSLEEKYAQQLGVSKESISNKTLYSFINEWEGVRYEYGGKTKKGVDCSGFASILYKEVFGREISGSSRSIYDQCSKLPENELKEGDLVFFAIESKDVSHVGIYLQNNKFVHATTKAGVRIDDLHSEYYKKYFSGGGR